MKRIQRLGAMLTLAIFVALPSCVAENQAAPQSGSRFQGTVVKGGDGRTGEYNAVEGWWPSAAPGHDAEWTWGNVSGLAADHPDRIIVAVWGDRSAEGHRRETSSNLIVVVDGDGEIIERWTQWDSILYRPHQVYISPYDPERHVWVVERGGGPNDIHEQIIKFTNDGSEIALRLRDPNPIQGTEEVRQNPNPGPLDFGQPSVLTFLPNGDFLLGDGYQNGRIVRYNAGGELVHEFGSVGAGPGQFDLIHGIAVDSDLRIYVSDRENDRIQIFSEDGEFIEEWPDIIGPTDIHIDENEDVWVLSATTNGILKYNRAGELQYRWGTYGGTRGGFPGGLDRPHQMNVDQAGNVYVASWDGGWADKFAPKVDADPGRLLAPPVVLTE